MARISATVRRRARERLDARRQPLTELVSAAAVPRGGWLRAMREALGMPAAELGRRLGVGESSVLRMEANEQAGVIGLDTLRRAADALGCDLVYALVPRRPLAEVVQAQAREQAVARLAPVAHSMALEGQAVDDVAARSQLEEEIAHLIDAPGLWGPPERGAPA